MLVILSVDHRLASVAEREPFSLPEAERCRIAAAVRRTCGRQFAFLVTCNRTEVITWVAASRPVEALGLVSSLARRLSPVAERFLTRARVYSGGEAGRHLCRVAAGLESQLPGDSQVLGQVRAAYRFASEWCAVGAELHRLFQTALRAGKRVQSETGIGGRMTTVGGEVATALLEGGVVRRLVILGAGKTAEAAAKVAAASGIAVTIINRTPERAVALALRVGAETAPFDARHQAIGRADAAIVTTAAPSPTVLASELAAVRHASSGGPLVLVDLAIPRNIEPQTAGLPGVTLLGLDHFRRPNDLHPEAAGRAALAIVEREAVVLDNWLERRWLHRRHVA